ncbi:MAG: RNA polymerase sigma factor [Planctomycetota bacterium]|jgi:RNA polymerase sigma-70 factor (ECF subfamily)
MLQDKLLIWKFNHGNPDVLRLIYEKYKDDLLTLATALLYNKTEAGDVIQDVFLTLIKSSQKLRFNKSLKGYLTTCVANNARNRNRANAARASAGLDKVHSIASGAKSPDIAAIFGEELRLLSSALAQLPYDQREVILLRLYSRMKFKAIAALSGQSINTIQGRYRYGLEKLRSLMNGEVKK